MKNNPALLEQTAEAIEKIQGFGYEFAYDILTQKYQVCKGNPDGSLEVEHEFDNWEQVIAFADNIHDERNS